MSFQKTLLIFFILIYYATTIRFVVLFPMLKMVYKMLNC